MPSRLANAFETHPVFQQYHHNQNLDLNSLQDLPESHAWASELNDYSLSPDSNGQFNLPVIDLNDSINGPKHLVHACKTWGAFQITNHGVSNQVIDRMEAAAKKLFSLPYQQKLKAERCEDGAVGYGPIRISSFFPKRMWSEGFTIVGSPIQHVRKLWPDDYTSFWYMHTLLVYSFSTIMVGKARFSCERNFSDLLMHAYIIDQFYFKQKGLHSCKIIACHKIFNQFCNFYLECQNSELQY